MRRSSRRSSASRAFLTVGRKELAAFANLPRIRFLVRLVEPPDEPLPLADSQLMLGRGPFDEADELQLLRRHEIDLVIAKQSGGDATYGKIAAARDLRIPVILLRRPAPPAGYAPAATVETVEAAVGVARGHRLILRSDQLDRHSRESGSP